MKLIQTEDYLLLIDEEAEIKEENIAIHDFGMGYDLEIPCDKDNLKSNTRKLVVAYYPLTKEAEELDLPLLPNPFENEIDVEKLALETTRNLCYSGPNANRSAEIFIWMSGYKAAQQSDKQFSLEDVKKAFLKGRESYSDSGQINTFKSFIQSLSTQQLPKEFIPEYEEIEVDKYVPKMTIDKLKTIINSEDKEEIVGTYKY